MEPVSILPLSVSDLERDLELALARIEHVEIPIATLWNPWLCPLEVLPFLAWALSVDSWRSDWSETVKRRMVFNSLSIHRIKGTRPAVELAIDGLGLDYEITEWFESAPEAEPGTFKLDIFINDDAYSSTNDRELEDVINNAKNVRSHLERVNIHLSTEDDFYIGCCNLSGETTELRPWQLEEIKVHGSCQFGIQSYDTDILTIYPEDTVSMTISGILPILTVIHTTEIVSIKPGVS
ncbi:phage tail protein I (plasmid) [Vibrio cyclitrophicus]